MSSLFNELCQSVQGDNETVMEFCMRLMALREKVSDISKEEGCPFNETLLTKRFVHSLTSGLRSMSLRNQLHVIIKNLHSISDDIILCELSDLVSQENEHTNKLESKGNSKNTLTLTKSIKRQNKVLATAFLYSCYLYLYNIMSSTSRSRNHM